jgi:hypothetical protein
MPAKDRLAVVRKSLKLWGAKACSLEDLSKDLLMTKYVSALSFLDAVLLFGGDAATSSSITFNKDVLPIVQKHCQSCHRPGQIAPMSFLTYESTRPWAKAMKVR